MIRKFKIQDLKFKISDSIKKSFLPATDRQAGIFNLQSLIKSRAFTLLEVLISLAIVSITLVVLIHSQLLSIRQGTHSGYYTTAIFLGNEILSDTLMQENLIAGDEDDDFPDYPDYSWSREVEDTEIGGLKKVKIVILGPENTQIILNTYWVKK